MGARDAVELETTTECLLSLVVTSYTITNIEYIRALHRSLCDELSAGDEVVYVIERCPELAEEIRHLESLPSVSIRVEESEKKLGLSGARNMGVRLSKGDWIAFIDDDATLQLGWRDSLFRSIADHPEAIGFTGPSLPAYAVGARSLCPEVNWVNSCWKPRKKEPHRVRNAIGVNMIFSKVAFEQLDDWFNPDFGAVQGTSGKGLVGEEVDFAIRVQNAINRPIMFIPNLAVNHQISIYRTTWKFISHRSKTEGRTKAVLRRVIRAYPISMKGMSRERGHLVRIFCIGIPREIFSLPMHPIRSIFNLRDLVGSTWLVVTRFIWSTIKR